MRGSRDSHAYVSAIDQLHSKQLSYQTAENYLEQISKNESWFNQNSQLIKRSLNDDFIAWADTQFEGGYSQVRDILSRDRPEEIQPLVQEFIKSFSPEQNIPSLTSKAAFYQEVHAEKKTIGNLVMGQGDGLLQKMASPLTSEVLHLKQQEIS